MNAEHFRMNFGSVFVWDKSPPAKENKRSAVRKILSNIFSCVILK